MRTRIGIGLLAILLIAGTAWGQAVSILPDAQTATVVNVSCATTATSALAANARRRSWLVAAPKGNAETIFLGFTSAVTTGTGLPMDAGATMFDSTYLGSVFCIVTANAQPLRVSETAR